MNASFTEQPCEIILWFFLLHEMNGDINTGGLFTMFIPSSPCVLKGSCIFSTSEYISHWYQMQFSDMWNLWIRQGFFSELVNTVASQEFVSSVTWRLPIWQKYNYFQQNQNIFMWFLQSFHSLTTSFPVGELYEHWHLHTMLNHKLTVSLVWPRRCIHFLYQ